MLGARASSPALLLSPTSRKIKLHPVSVLLDEGLRPLDWKAACEGGITFQEAIDGRVVAGRNPPTSIFTNQVLLDDELAIRVERFTDVRVHRGIDNSQIT